MPERIVGWEHRETGLAIITRDEAGKLRRYEGCRLEGADPKPGAIWPGAGTTFADLRLPGQGAK